MGLLQCVDKCTYAKLGHYQPNVAGSTVCWLHTDMIYRIVSQWGVLDDLLPLLWHWCFTKYRSIFIYAHCEGKSWLKAKSRSLRTMDRQVEGVAPKLCTFDGVGRLLKQSSIGHKSYSSSSSSDKNTSQSLIHGHMRRLLSTAHHHHHHPHYQPQQRRREAPQHGLASENLRIFQVIHIQWQSMESK